MLSFKPFSANEHVLLMPVPSKKNRFEEMLVEPETFILRNLFHMRKHEKSHRGSSKMPCNILLSRRKHFATDVASHWWCRPTKSRESINRVNDSTAVDCLGPRVIESWRPRSHQVNREGYMRAKSSHPITCTGPSHCWRYMPLCVWSRLRENEIEWTEKAEIIER